MSWILLEGLDRSGKSSVAEYYKKQGYEVVHMSAPDKKHFEPGYAGPSYLEEIVEMYSIYKGKDVVFDRTPYGEMIWPEIFNRMPLLNKDDYEYLQQLEYHENAERYLLFDEDVEAHWKRCLANNEPINRVQFKTAERLYDRLVDDYDFERKQIGDFSSLATHSVHSGTEDTKGTSGSKSDAKGSNEDGGNSSVSGSDKRAKQTPINEDEHANTDANADTMERKLDRANAIRSILSGQIVKKKGSVYADIEQDIRAFLEKEIAKLFVKGNEEGFTEDEILILKNMAKRIKEKME